MIIPTPSWYPIESLDRELRDRLRERVLRDITPAFRGGMSLTRQREFFDRMGADTELTPGLAVERRELAGRISEWLVNPGHRSDHVLVHLHGGGFVIGSTDSHRAFVGRLALASGITAIVPEYRLAPEHRFPAGLDDTIAIYHAVLALGLDPQHIVLSGDSAGGNLVLGTLLALRDAGAPLPAAAVLLSPFLDLTASGESVTTRAAADPWLDPRFLGPLGKLYAGDHDRGGPRISPLFADLRGLPPLLIQVGDQEILLSDSTRLAERARAAGVAALLEVWPEVWHVFQFFAPALPDASAAIANIGAFVRRNLGLG